MLERFPVLGVCENEIAEAIAILIDCYQKGGKLLVCGNGGSAADSLHIVGELMKGFVKQRRLPPQMKEQLCRVSAEKLGMGLSYLIDIFNPERIVIGSVFARSEDLFRKTMEKVIRSEALAPSRKICQIVPAALGDAIGDIAALSVAIDRV